MNYSKDYEKHGGKFAVSYTVPPEHQYDTGYTEYAYQDAARQMSNKLYDALMHTKQPAVVELQEHTDRVPSQFFGDYDARLTITARITPVETHHIVMPSYQESSFHYTPPSVRTAVRYWLSGAYKKMKRNWQAK